MAAVHIGPEKLLLPEWMISGKWGAGIGFHGNERSESGK